MVRRLVVLLFTLIAPVIARSQELDPYGGWKDVPLRASGAFRMEEIGGRELLVTPEGHPFLAIGINHLGAIKSHGESEPDLFATRYQNSWSNYADDVLENLDEWGLNAVDNTVALLCESKPYFAAANFVKTAKYYGKPGEANLYEFPDVFDIAVQRRLENFVAEFCSKHVQNKNLIAYYWTDTPTWDLHKTRRFRQTDWVSEIRRLPAGTAGRERYGEFLCQQYEDSIDRFNRAYDLGLESFESIAGADLSKLDLSRYEIERDDQAFLGVIAKHYYATIATAMRKHDPEHMIFGEKYLLGDLPDQVLSAAVEHVDAIAIQPGDGYLPIYVPGDRFPSQEITELREASGKPIMICDHQISFATERYPKSIWPYHQLASEAEAAEATNRFMIDAFRRPYVIGYMRCQYIDRYSSRRGASKLGLLRDDGTPYPLLVEATRRASEEVRESIHAELVGSNKGFSKSD
jgi:hypothetical protein